MEEVLWFAAGSVAGAALAKWGREVLMGAVTTAIVVGDAVAAGANRVAEVVATRTAEQRKQVGEFFAEAQEKARRAKPANSQPARA
jgi:hypothetical protein